MEQMHRGNIISDRSDTSDLGELERTSLNDPLDVFLLSKSVAVSGNCRACLTDPTSPLLRFLAGGGEFNRGGRGGGAVPGTILKTARGGGGSGPAIACMPGW